MLRTKEAVRAHVSAKLYPDYITNKDRSEYFNTKAWFDLVFRSLNSAFKTVHNLDDFYRSEAPDSLNKIDVIDIHTHMVRDEWPPPDRLGYFRLGQAWWFCPERFEINRISENGADKYRVTVLEANERTAFKRKKYGEQMFGSSGQTRIAIACSAPANWRDPGGSADGWMIRIDDLARNCLKLNADYTRHRALCAGRLFISGFIDPPLDTAPQQPHAASKMAYWKLYSGDWPPGDVAQLLGGAGGAFEKLKKQRGSGVSQIVCLHWSMGHDSITASTLEADGSDEPYGSVTDLGKLAKDHQSATAAEDLNFVVFHAAFSFRGSEEGSNVLSEHRKLAKLTRDHRNLYIEIGHIFSSLALYFHKPTALRAFVSTLLEEARPGAVLWGTDAIWYGSPQWQIEAFKRLKLPAVSEKDELDFKKRVLRTNAVDLFKDRLS